MMYDLRLNILNENVEKFIVAEALYSHSGKQKKLNFDINNYPKFKDKIIYIVIDKEPDNIQKISPTDTNLPGIKRANSIKRIELSYNSMLGEIKKASDDDLIILSDNDEIPNLKSSDFLKSTKDIIAFKQLFFYYKFNLHYDRLSWFGSKACKKGKLLSLSWLNNLKTKKYPFWRLDTLFSNSKHINIDIINNGGWHFSHLMTPEQLYEKLINFGHHSEFEQSGLTLEDIKNKVKQKKVFYNHFADKSKKNNWDFDYPLKKVDNNILPEFLSANMNKYKEWFDG
jgi:beta-1,4-mannosyl-glycoprotein beta-1,4-N-acetylglucosaminyltransferase